MENKDYINKDFIYAIIGASNNPEKYGHIVLKDLYDNGYRVVPINPKDGEILGLKAYPDVATYGGHIDVAVMVLPPERGIEVLPQLNNAGINHVWFQPGSESEECRKYCEENGLDCVMGACIMVVRRTTEAK